MISGQGSVAGHVAGCAEAVHRYVESYHERIFSVGEPEHRAEEAERSHDGPPGTPGQPPWLWRAWQ